MKKILAFSALLAMSLLSYTRCTEKPSSPTFEKKTAVVTDDNGSTTDEPGDNTGETPSDTPKDNVIVAYVTYWDTVIPDAAGLDAAEQDSVTSEMTDLYTLQSEYLLRFISGGQELNDETWQAYLDAMDGAGLSHVMSVYQSAYDDYLAEVAAMSH